MVSDSLSSDELFGVGTGKEAGEGHPQLVDEVVVDVADVGPVKSFEFLRPKLGKGGAAFGQHRLARGRPSSPVECANAHCLPRLQVPICAYIHISVKVLARSIRSKSSGEWLDCRSSAEECAKVHPVARWHVPKTQNLQSSVLNLAVEIGCCLSSERISDGECANVQLVRVQLPSCQYLHIAVLYFFGRSSAGLSSESV